MLSQVEGPIGMRSSLYLRGMLMWAKLMTVPNGYVARVWKDLYDAEGVALRIVPPLTGSHSLKESREIWVPDSKTHVAVEIMRKV